MIIKIQEIWIHREKYSSPVVNLMKKQVLCCFDVAIQLLGQGQPDFDEQQGKTVY